MAIKERIIFFALLFFFNASYSTDLKEPEFDSESILSFVEFNDNGNQVTFKKNIIPLLQDLLDEKDKKDDSFFKKETILTILGLGAIGLNFVFVFKLFDRLFKNSEDIEALRKENSENIGALKESNSEIMEHIKSNLSFEEKNREGLNTLSENIDFLIKANSDNLELIKSNIDLEKKDRESLKLLAEDIEILKKSEGFNKKLWKALLSPVITNLNLRRFGV